MTLQSFLLSIDEQLTRKRARYGRASATVLGRNIEAWGYRAVLRRDGQSSLYNRYIFRIDGARVSRSAVAQLFKEKTNAN